MKNNDLLLITRAAPPDRTTRVQNLAQGTIVVGPFPVGSLVRVTASIGNIYFVFESNDYVLETRSAGEPLYAGDRVDLEVMDQERRYVHAILDTDSTAGFFTARITARRNLQDESGAC